jgi:hypothetical protein
VGGGISKGAGRPLAPFWAPFGLLPAYPGKRARAATGSSNEGLQVTWKAPVPDEAASPDPQAGCQSHSPACHVALRRSGLNHVGAVVVDLPCRRRLGLLWPPRSGRIGQTSQQNSSCQWTSRHSGALLMRSSKVFVFERSRRPIVACSGRRLAVPFRMN